MYVPDPGWFSTTFMVESVPRASRSDGWLTPIMRTNSRSYGSQLLASHRVDLLADHHERVADSNRWHPGAGHLDFKSILNVLFASGYQGYVSVEFLPKPDADSSARLALANLRKILRS